jgi:hypothetical protein
LKLEATIQLGAPVVYRGIVLCPLFPRLAPRAGYATLDEALPLGFAVTEVDESGAVPELAVHNPLDKDVLLYDGEELLGAKQNRILNVTVLVGAHTKTRIPVSCVEQGRWASRSATFAAAPHAAHPELRRRKSAQLLAAPLARGTAQHVVWDEVRMAAERVGASSPTSAHSDTYVTRDGDLAALRGAFPLAAGQCGAVFALGDSLCLDYVSRPEAWTRLYPKLLDGYLLDALGRLDGKAAAGVEQFVAAVAAATSRRQPSAGRGEDLRLAGEGVIGSGLELDGELLQLSAFTGGTERPHGSIARPTARRPANAGPER